MTISTDRLREIATCYGDDQDVETVAAELLAARERLATLDGKSVMEFLAAHGADYCVTKCQRSAEAWKMHAHATQHRADCEEECKRLRAELAALREPVRNFLARPHAVGEALGTVDLDHPLIVAMRAGLGEASRG